MNKINLSPNKYCSNEEIPGVIEGIEYVLQLLWGFNLDRNYHRYWFTVVGCTCPKLDNESVVGSYYRYINSSCPFHSF